MIDKINNKGSYDFQGGSSTNKRKNPAVRAYENTPGFKEGSRGQSAVRKKEKETAKQADHGVVLDLSSPGTDKKKKETGIFSARKEPVLSGALRKFFAPVVHWLRAFWESDRPAKETGHPAAESSLPPEDVPLGDLPSLEEPETEEEPEADENLQASIALQASEGLADAQGPETLQATGTNETFQDTAALPETEDAALLKKAAEEALKSGNLSRIEQVVTKNGTRRLAHNSDLLTYYDRRGQFVEMDETEKHRVLYGDKNVMKL